jgi:hypothetical protein
MVYLQGAPVNFPASEEKGSADTSEEAQDKLRAC